MASGGDQKKDKKKKGKKAAATVPEELNFSGMSTKKIDNMAEKTLDRFMRGGFERVGMLNRFSGTGPSYRYRDVLQLPKSVTPSSSVGKASVGKSKEEDPLGEFSRAIGISSEMFKRLDETRSICGIRGLKVDGGGGSVDEEAGAAGGATLLPGAGTDQYFDDIDPQLGLSANPQMEIKRLKAKLKSNEERKSFLEMEVTLANFRVSELSRELDRKNSEILNLSIEKEQYRQKALLGGGQLDTVTALMDTIDQRTQELEDSKKIQKQMQKEIEELRFAVERHRKKKSSDPFLSLPSTSNSVLTIQKMVEKNPISQQQQEDPLTNRIPDNAEVKLNAPNEDSKR